MGGVRIKSNHALQIKFAQMSQKTHEVWCYFERSATTGCFAADARDFWDPKENMTEDFFPKQLLSGI